MLLLVIRYIVSVYLGDKYFSSPLIQNTLTPVQLN